MILFTDAHVADVYTSVPVSAVSTVSSMCVFSRGLYACLAELATECSNYRVGIMICGAHFPLLPFLDCNIALINRHRRAAAAIDSLGCNIDGDVIMLFGRDNR